ncbi:MULTISPECIES: very short patch repair endonuclease [unclassified Sphingopyxis]|uniref:very short patch repair endonuclease n=1 Tax=unclassified Sphingopyxis TaxID=2614943 RepID=UPI00285746DE|nr:MULTISPECIES: very short patch repair endonuclease [unclassified Sphingopyxis]MDR6833605.1 DNA mismatch endonuclease (patch repair protein) [Sphingopyxis sp. BE122]MDR7225874.1 DNA mismatch endonuclease (patch repair protein) [Sphingopyxis sp. BE259]
MADTLSPHERSVRMGLIKERNTKPEMAVRRLLHAKGFRYRLHANELPGKPDIVFRRRRKAIFVHGCFWHRHTDPECNLARFPKSRAEFWRAKFEANQARDAENCRMLREMGWNVLVVWECELRDAEQLGNKLERFVRG